VRNGHGDGTDFEIETQGFEREEPKIVAGSPTTAVRSYGWRR